MTPQQATLVQGTFASLAPRAEEVADLFYDRLFELDPDLENLFNNDMAVQGRKLMQMLAVAVNALCKFYEIVPAVKDLGKRHVHYGVKEPDYQTVGAALIAALDEGLGSAFTDEVREAWVAAYTRIAETMREGAELEESLATHDAEQPSA